jgi:hypothetical protein
VEVLVLVLVLVLVVLVLVLVLVEDVVGSGVVVVVLVVLVRVEEVDGKAMSFTHSAAEPAFGHCAVHSSLKSMQLSHAP